MEWVNKNQVKKYMKVLRDAIETFNEGNYGMKVIARLVGSANKNLVLTNDSKGSFDCDVDIIVTTMDRRTSNEETRVIFNNYIGPKLRNVGYNSFTNRTKTFMYKKTSTNSLTHSFDLMIQINDDVTYSVNKSGNNYSIGAIRESRNYNSKEKIIKNENRTAELRNLYKSKKERNTFYKESYILYCECLNELTQRVR